jgi:hypothetical protein
MGGLIFTPKERRLLIASLIAVGPTAPDPASLGAAVVGSGAASASTAAAAPSASASAEEPSAAAASGSVTSSPAQPKPASRRRKADGETEDGAALSLVNCALFYGGANVWEVIRFKAQISRYV